MEDWRANIKAIMRETGVTQPELAERTGMSQSWVSNKLTGRTNCEISDLELIANALGVSVKEILFRNSIQEGESTYQAGRSIPVLLTDQVVRYLSGGEITPVKTVVVSNDQSRCFGLIVQGNSMSGGGPINIPAGATVIIDSSPKAINDAISTPTGSAPPIVLAKHGHDIIIRRLVTEGTTQYLEPINQQYPIATLDQNEDELLGVIVKAIMEWRD